MVDGGLCSYHPPDRDKVSVFWPVTQLVKRSQAQVRRKSGVPPWLPPDANGPGREGLWRVGRFRSRQDGLLDLLADLSSRRKR